MKFGLDDETFYLTIGPDWKIDQVRKAVWDHLQRSGIEEWREASLEEISIFDEDEKQGDETVVRDREWSRGMTIKIADRFNENLVSEERNGGGHPTHPGVNLLGICAQSQCPKYDKTVSVHIDYREDKAFTMNGLVELTNKYNEESSSEEEEDDDDEDEKSEDDENDWLPPIQCSGCRATFKVTHLTVYCCTVQIKYTRKGEKKYKKIKSELTEKKFKGWPAGWNDKKSGVKSFREDFPGLAIKFR